MRSRSRRDPVEVSVVVVCRDERGEIARCLTALLAQRTQAVFEVIVVDGRSGDGTREIVSGISAGDSRVRLIDNPQRSIATGRNRGVEVARGDFIAFTDADCEVPPDWLDRLLEGFRSLARSEVRLAAVGGGNRPPDDARGFVRALAVARTTFWGNHGSIQGRSFSRPTIVDHVPTVNALYDRAAILEVNGFEESFANMAEDVDLSLRLSRAGRTFAYLPACDVVHRTVRTPAEWTGKMIAYGRGRTGILRRHGLRSGVRFLVPPLFVGNLILAVAAGWRWPILWIPVIAYIVASAAVATYCSFRCGAWRLAPAVFAAFLLTHVPYGIGELSGLLDRRSV